jgi:hypothetical protein
VGLAIDTDSVEAVLLADGWHEVHGHSFDLDAYEFVDEGRTRGGTSGVSSTGFEFFEAAGGTGYKLAGPLTAIVAVRHTSRLEVSAP